MSSIKYSHTLWSPADTVKDAAEALGISNLPDDVARTLAMDVEYRIHEIIEQAMKFARHSKRTALETGDISAALRVLNVEPLYGHEPAASKALKFREAMVGPGQTLYYVDDDEDADLERIINMPLPKVPRSVSFTAHWLAVEGVQPAISQNPSAAEIRSLPSSIRGASTDALTTESAGVDIRLLVRHVVSRELQLYFDKVVEALLDTSNTEDAAQKRLAALSSLRNDPGIHQLVPYFVQFVQEKLTSSLKTNLALVRTMLEVISNLLDNSTVFMEPYIHHVLPSILTVLLAKNLGGNTADSYPVRDLAASLLSKICSDYSDSYESLRLRITRTLLKGYMDTSRPPASLYGAVIGIVSLGPELVRFAITGVGNAKAWVPGVYTPITNDFDKRMLGKALIQALQSLKVQAAKFDANENTVDKEKFENLVGPELTELVEAEPDSESIMFALLYGDASAE